MKFLGITNLSIQNLRYELGELDKMLNYSPPKKDQQLARLVEEAQVFHLMRVALVFKAIVIEIGEQIGIHEIDFTQHDSFFPVLEFCCKRGLLATNHVSGITVLLRYLRILSYDIDYEMDASMSIVYNALRSKVSRLYLALQRFSSGFLFTVIPQQKELSS